MHGNYAWLFSRIVHFHARLLSGPVSMRACARLLSGTVSMCPVALWNRKHVPGYSGTVSMWACAWFLSETGKEAQKSSKPTEKMHGNNDMQRAHVRPINRKERAHERSFQSV